MARDIFVTIIRPKSFKILLENLLLASSIGDFI